MENQNNENIEITENSADVTPEEIVQEQTEVADEIKEELAETQKDSEVTTENQEQQAEVKTDDQIDTNSEDINQKTKKSEKKNDSEKLKKRVEKAKHKPIDYFYDVTKSRLGTIEFVEICQTLNDKFNGKITQSVFYPVAEQSARIFELNGLLFERTIKDSLTYPKIKFAVYVSPKWFMSEFRRARLFEYFKQMKDNVYLIFDSVGLTQAGVLAVDGLKEMAKEFRFKFIFDNAEYQNLSQMISYHPDYVRIDARFIDKTDENYTLVFRFLKDYCKIQKHKLVVKHVKDDILRNYLLTNNVDAVEGNGVYKPKVSLNTILSDFKI